MKELLPNPHALGCFWHDAAVKYGAPNIKWCEETLCHLISEPANTFSNIAYFIATIVLLYWTKNLSKEHKFAPIAMLLMGAGSFYYHMSNNYLSQIIDFIGMYIFIFWLLTLNLRRLNLFQFKGSIAFYLSFIVLNTVGLHIMYLNRIPFQILVALAGVLIVGTEFMIYKKSQEKYQYKFLGIGVALIIIAESFSILDATRAMCDPQNHIVQGHAIWHVLSAIGLTIAYKHWKQFKF